MNVKLAITDDHPLILEGLVRTFKSVSGIEIINTYANASDTQKGLQQEHPDVLLLDINLPDSNGIDLCEQLKTDYPQMKIIALTSFNDLAIIRSFMQHKGDGFLLKTSAKEQLLEAIGSVMKGGTYLHPEVQKILIAGNVNNNHAFIPRLTQREKEVLKQITNELTTTEIADKLCIGVKTVETHRKNLLSKMGVKNTAGLVKVAIERGLI